MHRIGFRCVDERVVDGVMHRVLHPRRAVVRIGFGCVRGVALTQTLHHAAPSAHRRGHDGGRCGTTPDRGRSRGVTADGARVVIVMCVCVVMGM